MITVPSLPATPALADEWLFGWDPTPGIVSVWADRTGRALVWQRAGENVTCTPGCTSVRLNPRLPADHIELCRDQRLLQGSKMLPE